jgi:hypothetical protein
VSQDELTQRLGPPAGHGTLRRPEQQLECLVYLGNTTTTLADSPSASMTLAARKAW